MKRRSFISSGMASILAGLLPGFVKEKLTRRIPDEPDSFPPISGEGEMIDLVEMRYNKTKFFIRRSDTADDIKELFRKAGAEV